MLARDGDGPACPGHAPRPELRYRSCDGRGARRATGAWIAFVDHDDVLDPDALLDVARLVREVPDLEMVYTDQDRLRADGTIGDPAFKSAWSVDLLRSTNCIVHLCCYRRSLLDALGGIREGFDGSQDYDLLLRVGDALDTTRIGHVARPRYHWRASAGSVASDPEAKPWAFEAARRALVDSLQRRNMRGRVEPHDVLGWYHTRYEIVGRPRRDGCRSSVTPGARSTRHAPASPTRAKAPSPSSRRRRRAPARRRPRSPRTHRPTWWRSSRRASWSGPVGSTAWASTRSVPMSVSPAARCVDDAGRRAFGLVVGGPAGVAPATPGGRAG